MADTTHPHRYFDDVAPGYDALYEDPMSHAENLIVAQEVATLISTARDSIDSVLDIGCGTGLMLDMAHYFGCDNAHYTGVDFSAAMLENFRKKYADRQRTETFQGDMNTFDFQALGNQFDLVLSTFGSFSYAEDPAKFLSDMDGVLRAGNGHLLVMAYSRFSVRNVLSRFQRQDARYTDERRSYAYRNDGDDSLADGPHAYFHTVHSLTEAARQVGLHRISVQGLNFFLDSSNTKPANFEEALSALLEERRQIPSPDLSHSLILTATNYE